MVPFISWSVVSAAIFATTTVVYRTYIRKRKSATY